MMSVTDVKTVGIVGSGSIGAGWAAHFLAQGLRVIAVDPGEGAEARMRRKIEHSWKMLEKKGISAGSTLANVTFQKDLSGDFATVDFVQESVPERIELKHAVIKAISEAVRADVVIASSASYLTPSDLQVACANPARFIVGHPFHPVYLIPLVEIVGGRETAPEAVAWAKDFYAHFGKSPLVCRKEVLGHIGNRLQRALISEATKLIVDGVGTTAEIDAAMTEAAGLRLPLFGPMLSRAIAGGDAGPATTMKWQQGNKIKFPFEENDPELTDELIEFLAKGMEEQFNGHSIAELEEKRDAFLIDLLELKKKHGF